MKITAEKLQEIIESHGKWLRSKDGGQRADLRGAYLQRANLQDANLQDANLQDAYLRGANLRGADLQDADLRGANLRGADLQDANLQRADLRGANLRGADLPNGIYQVVGCGSVNRCTTYDSINDRIICGCWNDDNGNHLADFEEQIEAVYGTAGSEPNQQYYNEYMSAIAFFKAVSKS